MFNEWIHSFRPVAWALLLSSADFSFSSRLCSAMARKNSLFDNNIATQGILWSGIYVKTKAKGSGYFYEEKKTARFCSTSNNILPRGILSEPLIIDGKNWGEIAFDGKETWKLLWFESDINIE